ncbi:hypothetical protein PYW07_017451 [Mythimna separata]|uniref:C-type lectin domain-containing protein n=1 Tax=Mythimna separata TaxID=271217 RepID=A0AAD8DXT6_MYTSE|nr:hypothetical protein PYW07_017451 [Mythimna separata]
MLKAYYFYCVPLLLILTEHARCESDYVYSSEAGGWLKLYTTHEGWEDALVKCHHDGAVLASPLNKGLANALQLEMAHFGVNSSIFLGTHDLYSKGRYVSVEGVPLTDMEIKLDSFPHIPGTGLDCLMMSVDGIGRFTSCTNSLPFICYRKPDNLTMNECNTYDNGYHLNEQTGSCYKIHLNKQTWSRAYSICASEGGYLVILNDAAEMRIVKDLFPPPPSSNPPWEGFYIGLAAWGRERIWTTIHGDKLEDVYNKWDSGEPNNYEGNQDRAQCLWNGNLDDTTKDTRAPLNTRVFACEKSVVMQQRHRDAPVPTPTERPRKDPARL